MIKIDLQFFGGRGSSSSGGGGTTGGNVGVLETTSLMSAREGQRQDVDETMSVFSSVYDEYGVQVDDIQIATLDAKSQGVMAYYDAGDNIAINQSYFNSAKMNAAYDQCVSSGYHPSRGNKTGLQAVTAHELGHKLTERVGAKMGKEGFGNLDKVSSKILKEAGVKTKSTKISGYARTKGAETIAEAFADVFCNGKKAHSDSTKIVNTMNKYLKGGN